MAGKEGNGLVISLSIFVLLSVGLGVAWYMTWSHSADLQRQLSQSTDAENKSKAIIQEKSGEVTLLKDTVGLPGDLATDVATKAKEEMAKHAGDGTSVQPTLSKALEKASIDRDIQSQAATDRNVQLQSKIDELKKAEVAHNEAMAAMKASLDAKEEELRKKERETAETISNLQAQVDSEHKQLLETQDQLVTLQTESQNKIEELERDIAQQREALIELRRDRQKLEGFVFEKPDGLLTFVDQNALSCFVNLGSADSLKVGTTFSVYSKDNSGVGRAQSDKDMKGKIVVTEILGDHLAKADIVSQKGGNPLGQGDPVYSPLFWPGQKLQLAVVGMLDFDGNPGSDRDEFHRIVSGSGAEIVIEIDDEGKVKGKNNEELSMSDIEKNITSETRFLLVGDLGDEDTEDTARKEINNRIRECHVELVKRAEYNGVYVISLSSFLDYIGYSSKSLVFSPTKPFPGKLSNGASSPSVNAKVGRRDTVAPVSGKYSNRGAAPTPSLGATSKLYQGNRLEQE